MDETTGIHLNARNRRAPSELSDQANSSLQRADSVEQRIYCLKLLALTLLREIEALEHGPRDDSEFDLTRETRRFESEIIRSALIETGGRQRRAARLLGMKVTTLNTKIRRYEIKVDENAVVAKNESEALSE